MATAQDLPTDTIPPLVGLPPGGAPAPAPKVSSKLRSLGRRAINRAKRTHRKLQRAAAKQQVKDERRRVEKRAQWAEKKRVKAMDKVERKAEREERRNAKDMERRAAKEERKNAERSGEGEDGEEGKGEVEGHVFKSMYDRGKKRIEGTLGKLKPSRWLKVQVDVPGLAPGGKKEGE